MILLRFLNDIIHLIFTYMFYNGCLEFIAKLPEGLGFTQSPEGALLYRLHKMTLLFLF